MSLRTRLLAVLLPAMLIPIAGLMIVVRGEMTSRLASEYGLRVDAVLARIDENLQRIDDRLAEAQRLVGEELDTDPRLRRSVLGLSESDRGVLLDYAGIVMHAGGLAFLQLQDEDGRILSSGHFRNEYDRIDAWPIEQFRILEKGAGNVASRPRSSSLALVVARAPEAPFLVFARLDSCTVGGRRLFTVAGVAADQPLLDRWTSGDPVSIELTMPGRRLASGTAIAPDPNGTFVRERRIPLLDATSGATSVAMLGVRHDRTGLDALRRDIDRWSLLALAVVAGLVALVSAVVAVGVTRPLAQLAAKAERVDAVRPRVDFHSGRKDEVGMLSRTLQDMIGRLRASADQVRDAERRATLGEVARQVNHDVRNGLTPLRNVFRHLDEVADAEPDRLAEVFGERRGTITSSIRYLEDLASDYARISSNSQPIPCALLDLARTALAGRAGDGRIALEVRGDASARILADEVAMRRILENLVANARDALGSGEGHITVSIDRARGSADEPVARVVVADDGPGLPPEIRDRVFERFFTTKPRGSGLGLSIVRRLVTDHQGSIRVESEAGHGTRFIMEFPLLDADSNPGSPPSDRQLFPS